MLTGDYFPPRDPDWERMAPAAAGLDSAALEAAAAFAREHETAWPRDIAEQIGRGHFEPPPWNEIIGPVKERAGQNGIVLRGGRIVAEWGDTTRADMTFSASKSYISACVGLAVDRGLIPDLNAPVRELVHDGGFEGPHNGAITWAQLLQQTSEWEGELWGKPDLVDRNRDLALEGYGAMKGKHRDLQPPGTYWEYNDVRVNRLALAALRVLKRPLPEVLRQAIMDPIGASDTWAWHGYRNSYVEIDGERMQSVSGGAHWGGGVFISTRDHARFGHLLLRRGRWGDRQLLSEDYLAKALTPCPVKPSYGYMFWLNTGRTDWPGAPASSFMLRGAGASIVWVDPEHDIVAVARWIDSAAVPEFVGRIAAAVRT